MSNKDDFKLDKNGDFDFTDTDKSVEYLRESILRSLTPYIGQTFGSVEASKVSIAETINNSISSSEQVKSSKVTSVKTRWENMGWKGRLKWRFMRLVFPREVLETRAIIDSHNFLVYKLNQDLENTEISQEFDFRRLDCPNWCHPDPKSVFDVTAQIGLLNPIEFVSVDIKI